MRAAILSLVLLASCTSCTSSKPEEKPDAKADAQPAPAPVSAQPGASLAAQPVADSAHASPLAGGVAPAGAEVAPSPGGAMTTGKQVVKGGEVLTIREARLTVDAVIFENHPCPPGVQCITSGILKTVSVTVDREGKTEKGTIANMAEKVVNGVMVRVLSVSEGPQAEIEAMLPLRPAATH